MKKQTAREKKSQMITLKKNLAQRKENRIIQVKTDSSQSVAEIDDVGKKEADPIPLPT